MSAPTLNSGYQSGNSTGNETTTVVTVPTTLPAGDLWFIAMVSDPSGQTFTFPVGFSKEWSDFTFISGNVVEAGVVAKKTSAGGEGNASVTLGTSERQAWVSFGVNGGSSTIHAKGTDGSGNSSTATFPAVTTSVDDCLLIRILFTDVSAGQTTPFGAMTGWTKATEGYVSSGGAVGFYYKTLSTHGTEASGTATLAVSEQWYAITFAIAPDQLIISPTSGIATGEAVGTILIKVAIAPSGITTAAAYGTPKVNQAIGVSGIASTSAMGGLVTAPQAVTVTPSGITSGQAIGTTSLSSFSSVAPSGIGSTESISEPSVSLKVSPSAIPGAEVFDVTAVNINVPTESFTNTQAFGTLVVAPQAVRVVVSGIATGAEFGDMQFTVSAQILVLDTVIPSEEVFGIAQLNHRLFLTGAASANTFGTSNVGLTIVTTSMVETEEYGEPTLEHVTAIQLTGMASGAAYGALSVLPQSVTIETTGIDSQEVVSDTVLKLRLLLSGVATVASVSGLLVAITLKPSSIGTGAAFGVARTLIGVSPTGVGSISAVGALMVIPSTYRAAMTGIASVASVSEATVTSLFRLTLTGIASAVAVNAVTIQRGAVTIACDLIASEEVVEDFPISLRLRLTGVSSAAIIGTYGVGQPVKPAGIPSNFVFGGSTLHLNITLPGLDSDETIPSQLVKAGPQHISSSSIGTREAVSGLFTLFGIRWAGIETEEAYGVIRANQRFGLDGIEDALIVSGLQANMRMATTGIATGYADGDTEIENVITVQAISIGTQVALGALSVARGPVAVSPAGMVSTAVVSSLKLNLHVVAEGVATQAEAGTLVINHRIFLESAVSIPAFGTGTLHTRIYLAGVVSAEAFSLLVLGSIVNAVGIETAESTGDTSLAQTIRTTGVGTDEAVGQLALAMRCLLSGIVTGEIVPGPSLALRLLLDGVLSEGGTGTLSVALRLTWTGLESAADLDNPAVLPQPVTIALDSLSSSGIMGTTNVVRGIRPAGIDTGAMFGVMSMFIFLAGRNHFRVKRDLRGWTVPSDKRSFSVRR